MKRSVKSYLGISIKGVAMGAANIIPGVSGGTVALITGVFEELIDSIKSFDLKALKLLFKGKLKAFADHVNLWFLLALFFGVAISIISIARILDGLFTNFPVYILAYFFGLILASIYFVGKTVEKWSFSVILTFIVGAVVALSISFLSPAKENDAFYYLIICGIVAVCSMILPGLSGSFVLILLGNYQLVMIDAVNNLELKILFPVVVGAAIGLIAFSHVLSWIFKKYRNQTISTLTGFILGSLAILWPWKNSFDSMGNIITKNNFGAFVDNSGKVLIDIKEYSYQHFIPGKVDSVVIISFVLVIAGIVSIMLMEKFATEKTREN